MKLIIILTILWIVGIHHFFIQFFKTMKIIKNQEKAMTNPPTPKLAEAKKLIEDWPQLSIRADQIHGSVYVFTEKNVKRYLEAQSLISYERGREDERKLKFRSPLRRQHFSYKFIELYQ